MKARNIVLLLVGLIIVGLIVVPRLRQRGPGDIVYHTTPIDRGTIVAYVSATGMINPVTTVEVGSPLSGMIKQIYVDFNTKVAKGQPLAELDQEQLKSQMKQVKASLEKVQNDMHLAKKLFEENDALYKKRLVSAEEYEDSQTKYAAQLAAVEQAQAAVEIATVNFQNAIIRSPIEGFVISRNVNIGQTVAASLQSPPLFLIAGNLREMKLDTNVSEVDIGKIHEGQHASFTVEAYPDRTFQSKVWQIRNAPIVVQNVVTYNVVLRFDNPDLQLKPGMTAQVKIRVAERLNTLRIPRAALRFIPPPAARIEDSAQPSSGAVLVWTLAVGGRLKAVPIKTGVSDEIFTELLTGEIKEGDAVIIEASEATTSRSQPLDTLLPQPKRF